MIAERFRDLVSVTIVIRLQPTLFYSFVFLFRVGSIADRAGACFVNSGVFLGLEGEGEVAGLEVDQI